MEAEDLPQTSSRRSAFRTLTVGREFFMRANNLFTLRSMFVAYRLFLGMTQMLTEQGSSNAQTRRTRFNLGVYQLTNCAVSSFRSHFGQTGRGTAQIFPLGPRVKNVASRCTMIDPHFEHRAGGGSVDRTLNTSSSFECRFSRIFLRYPQVQNGNVQYCSLLHAEGPVENLNIRHAFCDL